MELLAHQTSFTHHQTSEGSPECCCMSSVHPLPTPVQDSGAVLQGRENNYSIRSPSDQPLTLRGDHWTLWSTQLISVKTCVRMKHTACVFMDTAAILVAGYIHCQFWCFQGFFFSNKKTTKYCQPHPLTPERNSISSDAETVCENLPNGRSKSFSKALRQCTRKSFSLSLSPLSLISSGLDWTSSGEV